jgi:hypothetical protein
MRFTCLVAITISTVVAGSVRAQAAAPIVDDSTGVRITATGIFSVLAYDAANSLQRGPTPWAITVSPPEATPRWASVIAKVSLLVAARDTAATDSVWARLVIFPWRVSGDTVIAQFSIGGYARCRLHRISSETTYEARSIRHGASWDAVKTQELTESVGQLCVGQPSPPAFARRLSNTR